MTTRRKTPAGPRTPGQAITSPDPDPRTGEKDLDEMEEPYDLPFPDDRWPQGRPTSWIVVDQLRGWQPGGPPSSPSSWKPGPPAPANQSPIWKPNHDPDPEDTAMTLTINDTTMTSDQTPHTARQAGDPQRGWEVSWLPGQTLDRNSAITAMILADITSQDDLHEGHRLWPHIQGWAAELGLTGPDAITRASQPPRETDPQQERASGPPDREAAD